MMLSGQGFSEHVRARIVLNLDSRYKLQSTI